jgi:hypothetical protein
MKVCGGVGMKVHALLSVSHSDRFTPGDRTSDTQWTGYWMVSRTSPTYMERKEFLLLSALELGPLDCPARRKSLYRLAITV